MRCRRTTRDDGHLDDRRLACRFSARTFGVEPGLRFGQPQPLELSPFVTLLLLVELLLDPIRHGLRLAARLVAASLRSLRILGRKLPGALRLRACVGAIADHDAAIRQTLLIDLRAALRERRQSDSTGAQGDGDCPRAGRVSRCHAVSRSSQGRGSVRRRDGVQSAANAVSTPV